MGWRSGGWRRRAHPVALSFLDDDHVADETFVFSRQVVKDQLFGAGQSVDLTRIFSDQDAEYRLRLRVTRV